jgi:cytochrome c5
MRIFAMVLALLPLAAFAVELTDAQRAEVESRIKPFGQVCLPGDDCGAAGGSAMAAADTGAASAARSGEEVYNAACMACHATGAAGAPKVGDAGAWAPRIAKGMDALYNSGVNGVAGTGMMAKGGCMACTDDEVYAAVDFMVESSQ